MKPASFAIPSKRGNFVIGVCPSTETNVTLKTKCIAAEKHDVADYIWVSDGSGKLIYQNEFCALCHHVTKHVKWELTPTCSARRIAQFDSLDRILMSDGCQLKLGKPNSMTFPTCVVPDYSYCNQSGTWTTYDADIDWACSVYHSEFFANGFDKYFRPLIDVYKNVFCYYCNKEEVKPADPACTLTQNFGQVSKVTVIEEPRCVYHNLLCNCKFFHFLIKYSTNVYMIREDSEKYQVSTLVTRIKRLKV